MTKKLIIFAGMPANNNRLLADYLQTYKYLDQCVIIDRDDLRKFYPDVPYKDPEFIKIYCECLASALKTMPVVIAVAPLATKEERQIVFSYLKKVIEEEQPQIIGLWVERKYEHLKFLNQMKLSYQKLSDEDFELAYKYRESPQKDEGFDDVCYIIMDEEIGISQSSYGIQHLTDLLDTIQERSYNYDKCPRY